MGQKVNPIGMRLGITQKIRDSNWYANSKVFSKCLNEDLWIRDLLRRSLKGAGVSTIRIERPARSVKIVIYSARPGVILGKKGTEIEALKLKISRSIHAAVQIHIEEIRKPDLDAWLVAEHVAQQLERRVAFRRAMKRAMQTTMRQGALGVKIMVSGRLGGAEIARTEWSREGRVPLHTFRADIDYALAESDTSYGVIGVKVWIFKGEQRVVRERQEHSVDESVT